jgi:hypothetical protein
MKVEINKKYLSGLIANTDLHAGGLFFCIIYQNCLEFFDDGTVEFTKRLVDDFRPMDENDVLHLKNYKITGQYFINDRGYLVCKFDDLFWTLTGLSTEKNSDIIPFFIYDSRLLTRWSEVYKIEQIIQ